MTAGFESFPALPEQDRRDVFEAAATRLDTLPGRVEKDFWVCLILDALFNRRPKGHPRLLFKGGTSLSKAFGLIERFSEDIDLVAFRDGLGFEGKRDPTIATNLSNKKRAALSKELSVACRGYIREGLRTAIAERIDELSTGGRRYCCDPRLERRIPSLRWPAICGTQVHGTLCFVSDTRALIPTIIGTGLAVVTIVVTVLSMRTACVNTSIDDMWANIRDLWTDHVRFKQRLDAVEVAFGFG